MSEQEKLADVLHKACGNSFSEIVRLAIADVVLAAGYRLVSTEGPEFEAMVERAAVIILQTLDDHMGFRPQAELWAEADSVTRAALRAALETGERDG